MVFVTRCPHCLKTVIISSLKLLNKTLEVFFGFFAVGDPLCLPQERMAFNFGGWGVGRSPLCSIN